jgi:predicted nucleic acid-binding protein
LDEYDEVLRRPEHRRAHGLHDADVRRVLAGLVRTAELVEPRLHFRLVLKRDPDDAMIVETAIDAGADHLLTHKALSGIRGAERQEGWPRQEGGWVVEARW